MRKIGFFLIAGLAAFAVTTSPLALVADLSVGTPESVGMSSERLSRIGPVLQRYIDDGLVAGTVSLVARHGSIVHLEAQGYRDRESHAPMTTDAIFRLASMTKPITSVALMMLWEEGKVRLDDPVARYLPEFKDVQVSTTGDASGRTGRLVPPDGPMTVRQMLTHTAGLSNRTHGNAEFYVDHMHSGNPPPGDTVEAWVKRLADLPLGYQPGTDWQYSHATDVVARLVEVISGQSFDEFLRQRIFAPLGMVDTSHYLSADKAGRLTAQYAPGGDGSLIVVDPGSAESDLVSGSKTLFRGSGGLLSTARDYVRFQQMVMNGGHLGETRLLGRKTVELMLANHVGALFSSGRAGSLGFGLGYRVVLDSGAAGTPQTEGSASWAGAFGTTFWIDPAEELVGILLIQVRPNSHLQIANTFRNLVYQAVVD